MNSKEIINAHIEHFEKCRKAYIKASDIKTANEYKKDIETFKTILKDLERLEQLESDNLLQQTQIEDLKREKDILNHNLEEKVEVIADLEKENQELKKQNEILTHNGTNIVLTDTEIMKRNLELQQENQELKNKLIESASRCEFIQERLEKLEKTFIIIKIKKVRILTFLRTHSLEEYNAYCFELNKLTQQEFDLLKEVLE